MILQHLKSLNFELGHWKKNQRVMSNDSPQDDHCRPAKTLEVTGTYSLVVRLTFFAGCFGGRSPSQPTSK